MANGKEESKLGYVKEAAASFNEIMANSQKNALDNFNRPHKGELFVLHFLELRSAPVLPSELSAALQSSTARISALLGALEKKGQIERDIDKSNRRNILVTITAAGRRRIEREMREMRGHLIRIFTEMGEADTAAFLSLTRRFFELFQKHLPPCPGDHD